MKKLSVILITLLLVPLTSTIFLSTANCDWYPPTQLTHNTASESSPSISGDGSKIAYVSNVDGDQEIFVVNSDGTGLTQLTHNTGGEYNPSISGDGSKIAYYISSEIFVVNSDGSGSPTQITDGTSIQYPFISSDGSKIAFVSYVAGDTEIFVINSDGTGLTQLTHNTAADSYPSISGDGSKIAFRSNVDGNYEIFVINSDGSGLTQVTDNTVSNGYPSISGDGTKIVFQSDVDGDNEIFLVNRVPDTTPPTGYILINGGAARTKNSLVTLSLAAIDVESAVTHMRFTNVGGHNGDNSIGWTEWEPYKQIRAWSLAEDGNATKTVAVQFKNGDGLISQRNDTIIYSILDEWDITQLTHNVADDFSTSISADGSKIAFESEVDGDLEIFVINSDGTGLTQLTSNFAHDLGSSISSDGSKIAFVSGVDGSDWEIFVINSDGSGLTQLTHNTANDWNPSISGDGTKITFESDVDGDSEIFVVNSDGSGLTQLTTNTAIDMWPSINYDGTKIAFQSNLEGARKIFLINYDGTGQTRLTNTAGNEGNPSISADGTKIAYDLIMTVDDDYEICVANSDGTGQTQLTSNSADDKQAHISADGSKITFYSEVDGDSEVFVVNSDGTGLIQITTNTASDYPSSISSDGSKIAYNSNVDGDYEIFVVTEAVDNTKPTDLPVAHCSISINGDAPETYTQDVMLTLFGSDRESGVPQMRLMNQYGTWTNWETYDPIKPWTLTEGDGTKRVYVEYMNGEGLTNSFYDDIVLNTPSGVSHDVVVDQTNYVVETLSNSTLSSFVFQQQTGRIQFSVEGIDGTTGFCNITIPAELMSGTFTIFKNDVLLVENMDYTQTFNGTHYTFNITYEHSTHTIEIFSTTTIPELTSIIMISTLIITTIALLIHAKKKPKKVKDGDYL